jgi:flagellar protein FlgJ
MLSPISGSAAVTPEAAKSAKIRDAAEQFEALFVAQMLRSAREASATGQDQSGQVLMEVAEEQIALAVSKQGGLGMVTAITRQMDEAQAAKLAR